MGEDRQDWSGRSSGQRASVREAAEKDSDGRVWIVLDAVQDPAGHRQDTTGQNADAELVEELRQTNELLREVITTRDEEIRRRDTIIMNMTEAMKALSPPAPEDSSEARESPESSGPTSGGGEVWEELDTEQARRQMAKSKLREGMAEEQRRREEAERERDDLRRELYALRDLREPPQTVEEEPERAEPWPAAGEAQEGTQRRPWWRRVFGG